MTGFGRGSATAAGWLATVEASSVNRKQAEIVVLAPRELAELDPLVRKAASGQISRGRLQINITLVADGGEARAIRVNPALAVAFHQAFDELSRAVGHPVVPEAADYLRQPGILDMGTGTGDVEAAWQAVEPALQSALATLVEARAAEGSHLKEDLVARLATLSATAREIARSAPDRPVRQREMFLKRLADAGLDLDPSDERVVRELAIFADRCDISEELTRLDAHFARFTDYLNGDEPPGRPLDFLCQELFREFNTIGSKANDAGIAHLVVEAKTELEKIREQVQNVE